MCSTSMTCSTWTSTSSRGIATRASKPPGLPVSVSLSLCPLPIRRGLSSFPLSTLSWFHTTSLPYYLPFEVPSSLFFRLRYRCIRPPRPCHPLFSSEPTFSCLSSFPSPPVLTLLWCPSVLVVNPLPSCLAIYHPSVIDVSSSPSRPPHPMTTPRFGLN